MRPAMPTATSRAAPSVVKVSVETTMVFIMAHQRIAAPEITAVARRQSHGIDRRTPVARGLMPGCVRQCPRHAFGPAPR